MEAAPSGGGGTSAADVRSPCRKVKDRSFGCIGTRNDDQGKNRWNLHSGPAGIPSTSNIHLDDQCVSTSHIHTTTMDTRNEPGQASRSMAPVARSTGLGLTFYMTGLSWIVYMNS